MSVHRDSAAAGAGFARLRVAMPRCVLGTRFILQVSVIMYYGMPQHRKI